LRSRHIFIAAALALLFVAQASWQAATTSGTFDESTYQRFGRGVYATLNTPQLAAWGVAPLPVLLLQAAPALAGWPEYPKSIALARASVILLIDIPLAAILYWTLLQSFGTGIAIAGAAFLLLSPSILGHASLATTDICFTAAALAALAALTRYLSTPTWPSLLVLVAGLSIALAAKYSAIGLFPVVAAASFLTSARATPSPVRRAVNAAALSVSLFVVALIAVWALHAFKLEIYGLPPIEGVYLPTPIVGIARQSHHQALGEPSFLLGAHSIFGWWYYIPVALAVKSTPAELVLWLVALVALVHGWRGATVSGVVWRLAFIVFLGAGLVNHIDFGIRYVLILFPLAVFLAAEQWTRRAGTRGLALIPFALVATQAVSAFTIAPHYLSYFNAFSGGPATGYTKLADSNIDWGQDLPALKSTIDKVGAKHVLLSYFGTAPVADYGIDATPWDGSVGDAFDRWDWVAISVTNLDGVYLQNDPLAGFRAIAPDARAGYSILLYRTDRDDVRQAMTTAGPRWP
jgi:4-amino-4-deoxy-L-arabinose transferase-like glycosyltransferase